MPHDTEIRRRDRALVAFLFLTGARVRAVASFKLRHVDIDDGCVYQDGREVQTKFGKVFETWFFDVGDDIRVIFEKWVRELREDLLFGPDDPLFPKTCVRPGADGGYEAVGVTRECWSGSGRITKIFKAAFADLGLPDYTPHRVRDTLTELGAKVCKRDIERMKAWSQNLGHERLMTTLANYGTLSPQRQRELIRGGCEI